MAFARAGCPCRVRGGYAGDLIIERGIRGGEQNRDIRCTIENRKKTAFGLTRLRLEGQSTTTIIHTSSSARPLRTANAVLPIFWCAVLIAVLSETAVAEDVALRLVAADRPDRPLCSKSADFRYSPFGGLVAVDWQGGITLDAQPLFPLKDIKAMAPAPVLELSAGKSADGFFDDLEQDLLAKRSQVAAQEGLLRDADAVDPMYTGKVFSQVAEFKEIGPRFGRISSQSVTLTAGSLLQPGDIMLGQGGAAGEVDERVRFSKGRVEVDCYAVRISAVRSDNPGRRVPFRPALFWGDRDLLADLRGDYSPALPTGAPREVLDDKGRPCVFYDLTVYLIPTDYAKGRSPTPYTLNGMAFHVGKAGVTVPEGTGALHKIGAFELQLVLPAEKETGVAPERPVFLDGGAGLSIDFKWPAPEFLNAIAVCKAAAHPDQVPVVHVFAAPLSESSKAGILRLYAGSWTAQGPRMAAAELAVRLDPYPSFATNTVQGVVRRGRAEAGNVYSLDVKNLAPGLYRVRFPELLAETADYDFIVCLSREGVRGSVSLFTHHNRGDYRQGETIELTAALRAIEPVENGRAELVFTDEDGRETPVGRLTFSAGKGGTDSRFVSVPAAQLQPGRYRIEVKSADGTLIGHRMLIQIFPRELRTLWEGFSTTICETGPFRTTEGLCSYRTMQNSLMETLKSREDVERYSGQTALPVGSSMLCRGDPLFPVEEGTARYDEAERTLATAMRFGVQHMPHGAWGMDGQTANWNPKHSYAESLDWMRRMYAQRAQIYREFASFGGFFVNWYPSLSPHYETHPAASGFAEFEVAALQKAIRDDQGPLPNGWGWSKENGLFLTQADGTIGKESDIFKAGVTHPLFNSPPVRELVEWKLRGQRRRTQAYASAYESWTEVCRTLGEWNYLSFVPVGWFRGPDLYPPIYFASLPRAGIEAYTDWQADPFMELFGIDYYGAGSGKPAWVQMMSGGRSMQIRQTFLSAARGAWGVGCDTGTAFPQGRAGENARLIADLMNRYGPWFMGMKPVSEVAIVRSFRQEAVDVGPFRDSGGRNGMIWFQGLQGELWALYYNLLRSGYPAAFITEEEIAAGGLARYKAVFLHRQRLLMPPELMKKFEEFAAAGGKVFKDPSSAAPYPGEVVELGPDETIKPDVGSSAHIIGARYLWMLQNYLKCRPRVEAVLARLPKPEIRSDSCHVVHASLAGKEASALFVINDTMIPAKVNEKEPGFIQSLTLTRKGSLFFDKPYFLYDVTEGGREAQATLSASGSFVYPVEFLRSEGRILVVTERPVRDVQVKAKWISRAEGDVLQVAPAVLDNRGKPFADALPFELAIRDPQGREAKRLYRAAGPAQAVELALGRNLAAGSWTITARELVTGREASAVLEVKTPPRVSSVIQGEGKVMARRPEELARFLAGKKALTLVLDEGQPESYRQAAEKMVAVLRRNGRTCDILRIDPLQVYDLPLRWRRNSYDSNVWERVTRGELMAVRRALSTLSSQEWACYDHPNSGYAQPGAQFALFRDVILLGSPRDNRLIADLHGVMNRPASANCPGPGRALIQVTWDAFAPRFDALSVQVEDAEGLDAACSYLEAALKESASTPVKEAVVASVASASPAVERPLPNVQRDGFGTPIGALQPIEGGSNVLVSLADIAISGSAYFVVDGGGRVAAQYPDILGGLTPLRGGRYLQSSRDESVLRNSALKPLWKLKGLGGNSLVIHPESLDIFLGEGSRVLRLDATGRTVWLRDFSGDVRTEADFLKPWKATVQAISEDGKRLLVSGYREQLYGRAVSGYEDPAVLMMDAATGATLWRKEGIMIRGTACAFVGDRIVACNSGDSPADSTPNLVLMDSAGNVIRESPVVAKLADVRPFGGGGLALVQEAGGTGAGLFDLNAGQSVSFPVKGAVKGAWVLGDRVAIATWAGELHVYDAALRPLQMIRLSSPAGAVIQASGGKGLIVGTESGQIQWLDERGKLLRTTDLNPYNEVQDESAWGSRWLASGLADVPMRRVEPWVGQPASTLDRARPHAGISTNLVKNGDFEKGADGWTMNSKAEVVKEGLEGQALRFSGGIAQTVACAPGKTYVLSLFQKRPEGDAGASGLILRVDFKGRPEIFQAILPLSENWEERTVSFRPPEGAAEAVVTLTPERNGKTHTDVAFAEIDRLTVCSVQFRSRNIMLQNLGKEPSIDVINLSLSADRAESNALGEKPPEIKQTIPWIAHLAKASGASERPPRLVMPWMLLVDGRISGHGSSWTGAPVPQGIFSDHVEMSVRFDQPRTLSLIALYEDTADPARYTRRFAVFARTKAGIRLLGSRANNQSPYNLFAFDPVEVESLLYMWAGSGDGHVRLMEMESY